MKKGSGVSYEDVAAIAKSTYEAGAIPTVESVIAVVGGKRSTVTDYLKKFKAQRNASIITLGQELESTKIAEAIAEELTIRLEQKTGQYKEVINNLQFELDDISSSMNKHSDECDHLIQQAESRANEAEITAKEKIAAANQKIEEYERKFLELEKTAEDARKDADARIKTNEDTCQLKLDNLKDTSAISMSAMEERAEKAENEAAALREQVKLLAIDQAQLKIEQKNSENLKAENSKANEVISDAKAKISLLESEVGRNANISAILEQRTNELAEAKAVIAKLETKVENFEDQSKQLTQDLTEAKSNSNKLIEAQTQLVEIQKQLSHAKADLDKSEREREALITAFKKDKE